MKIFILFFLLVTHSWASDPECRVYGISDSPQKLQCSFKNLYLSLTCVKGFYFINSIPVLSAYHLEVEEGSSPLVFQTKDMVLTVTMEAKTSSKGELSNHGVTLNGICL
jgi:hypothetical protein